MPSGLGLAIDVFYAAGSFLMLVVVALVWAAWSRPPGLQAAVGGPRARLTVLPGGRGGVEREEPRPPTDPVD